VATDEVIEQRLGEDPGDEDVKERLEREHTELLEELRALIPGARSCSASSSPSAYQPVHRPERGPALRLSRHAPEHGGRARRLRADGMALVGDRALRKSRERAEAKDASADAWSAIW
jgi:hypothetical protein